MNKGELIKVVVEVVDMFQVEVGCVVDVVFDLIVGVVKSCDFVVIVGFGIFVVKICGVCEGCNLVIGEIIQIKEKIFVVFRLVFVLKDI